MRPMLSADGPSGEDLEGAASAAMSPADVRLAGVRLADVLSADTRSAEAAAELSVSRGRRPRRATAPATRDGKPIEAELIGGQTLDDLDLDDDARGERQRTYQEWLRAQRPPHWG